MKKINTILLLFLSVAALPGCKDYFDLNDNPNTVNDPPPNLLLSTVTFSTALNYYRASGFTSYFTQYLANPGANASTDTYQPVSYETSWSNLYNTMTDLYDLKQMAMEQNLHEHLGVANVLMAVNLSLIVDIWGDIPFSEGFTGEILTPAYDDDQALYGQILQMLDEGIAALGQTGSAVNLEASSDFVHQGSLENWMKTAYALKARILNHGSRQADYDPIAVLEALDHAYQSNDDDAQVTRFQERNPWATVAISDVGNLLGGWLSEQLVDHMNGVTYGPFDPRLPKITEITVNGDYVGTPNGAGNVGAESNTLYDECRLRPGTFYASDESPLIIISYAETKFIEAEAALRASQPTRAYAAYQEGVTAHMNKLGVAAGARNAYLGDAAVNVGAGSLSTALIMKEKYVAMFLNPETWVDARRYDYAYKDFDLPVNAALETFIRRVAYPSSETSRNGDNVPEVALTDRVWWDQP